MLKAYHFQWQVELIFKRFKQITSRIVSLEHPPSSPAESRIPPVSPRHLTSSADSLKHG
ncbi:MAG: hypothetical protein LBD01_02330 [Puniceicoccales bacterium]|jgi:hypothetical protein|nr:hypothetical protein [Puniceicoccales bacterium]